MNNSKNLPIIGFLGDKGSLYRECERIIAQYSSTHPVQLLLIDPVDFSLQTLKTNKIEALIVDMKFDSENFDRVFSEIKNSFYPNRLYIVASVFNLTNQAIERAQKLGFSFIYQYSGQVLEESRFLIETTINCVYRSNLIRKIFAVAKVDQETIIQAPVCLKQISTKEIVFSSNIKTNDKVISTLKHEYLKKLNWRDSGLNIIKIEPCNDSLLNWNTIIKTELIKPEELDRFEVEFSQKFPNREEDIKFKQEELVKFATPILIEKKQNLSSFYRKHRFNCDLQKKQNVVIFSKTNLNFRFKKEEIINNFNLYKKSTVNPSLAIIRKIKPQVIFYELESVPEEVLPKDAIHKYNDLSTLRFLFQKIQEYHLQIPIIVFNPDIVPSSELAGMAGLKDLFQELSFKFNDNFIHDFLKEKIPEEPKPVKSQLNFSAAKNPDPVIYTSEREYANFGLIEFHAKIDSLTENEMIIQTNADLPEYTIFKAPQQFGLYFTIIPNEKLSQQNSATTKKYHAVINGITAEERDVLRGFVITFNKKNAA